MKKSYKILSNILLSIGACLIVCGAILYGVNEHEGNRAYAMSVDEIVKVKDEISRIKAGEASKASADPSGDTASAGKDGAEKGASETAAPEKKTLPVVTIDGYPYDGYLSIPAIDLEMPVVDSCNEEYLEYFLCRFYGDPYDGGMVIAGHNYRRIFRKIKELQVGDQVLLTTMDGEQFLYTVSDIEIIEGTGTEQMLDGNWDLTLFTCTFGGKERYTVRCTKT